MTSIATSSDIGITPLTGNIGAEIAGVDAAGPVSDEAMAQIRRALLLYKVVFLRGQRLDYATQVRFAQRLGPLTRGHPTLSSPPDKPALEEIDSRLGARANQWHTDVTFVDRPPAFTMLHAVVIPPTGGDTIWANTVAAYEALPPALQRLADTLRVVHTNGSGYVTAERRADGDTPASLARRREFVSAVFETEHPAVRIHPETAERALLLGGFANRVVGYSLSASRDLIRLYQDHITIPEHTVRWRWRVGDVAIWDNRATQHYAIYDYGTAHRRGERVTVAGPVPVGVDGRPSLSLTGDAGAYYAGAA